MARLNSHRAISDIVDLTKAVINVEPYRPNELQLLVTIRGARESKIDAACSLVEQLHAAEPPLPPDEHSSDREIGEMSQHSEEPNPSRGKIEHRRSRSRELSSPRPSSSPSPKNHESRAKLEIKVVVPRKLASDQR